MYRRVLVGPVAFALLTALPLGCGGGPKLVKVAGRVQHADGRPVTAASITFTPEGVGTGAKGEKAADGTAGPLGASAMLAADGAFVLRTYPQGDGAEVGRYKVTVSLGQGATTPALAQYTRVGTTPLTVDVPPGGLPDLTITLK